MTPSTSTNWPTPYLTSISTHRMSSITPVMIARTR
ncbi:Uncharacterised protein [Mycobacteroides abscessus]|nr:Uncharacterised protein [Mycobacteroides abscessus]